MSTCINRTAENLKAERKYSKNIVIKKNKILFLFSFFIVLNLFFSIYADIIATKTVGILNKNKLEIGAYYKQVWLKASSALYNKEAFSIIIPWQIKIGLTDRMELLAGFRYMFLKPKDMELERTWGYINLDYKVKAVSFPQPFGTLNFFVNLDIKTSQPGLLTSLDYIEQDDLLVPHKKRVSIGTNKLGEEKYYEVPIYRYERTEWYGVNQGYNQLQFGVIYLQRIWRFALHFNGSYIFRGQTDEKFASGFIPVFKEPTYWWPGLLGFGEFFGTYTDQHCDNPQNDPNYYIKNPNKQKKDIKRLDFVHDRITGYKLRNDIIRFSIAINTDLLYPIIPFIELTGEYCFFEINGDRDDTPYYTDTYIPDDFLFLIFGLRAELLDNIIIDAAYQQPISKDARAVYRAGMIVGLRIEF